MNLLQTNFPSLDIRAHGFLRVAVIVPRVFLGDPAENAREHIRFLNDAVQQNVAYASFPELGLTGYSCKDAFRWEALLAAAESALKRLVEWSATPVNRGLLFSVGLPVRLETGIFNLAVTIGAGRIWAAVPKTYLPDDGEFEESRNFAAAHEGNASIFQSEPYTRRTEIALCGQSVPFGNDLILQVEGMPGFRLYTEICEDGWVPVPVSGFAALAGATVIANLSASNVTIGKEAYRRDLMRMASGRHLCAYLYASAGYGESSSGMAWDGQAFVAQRGEVIMENTPFQMNGSLIVTDVDLGMLAHERTRQSSFRQNAANHALPFRMVLVQKTGAGKFEGKGLQPDPFLCPLDPLPFVPKDLATLHQRCNETLNIQAQALARRLENAPKQLQRVVLGYSGGRDSTLALLVSLRALEMLNLPRTNLECMSMPGFGTSEGTLEIARELPEALGVRLREISIKSLASQMFREMGLDPETVDLEDPVQRGQYENVQALTRKHILFSVANQRGMVVNTGDLTEAASGWCTFGADQTGYYAVNAGVGKTLVSYLIDWFANHLLTDERDAAARALLLKSLTLKISPELLPPGADGEIAQDSEAMIGPFELQDFFLYQLQRFGRSPLAIVLMAQQAFRDRINPLTQKSYTLTDVVHWLKVFVTRFFDAQKKRATTPEGSIVGAVSLDPRGANRLPSDMSSAAFLRELDHLATTL